MDQFTLTATIPAGTARPEVIDRWSISRLFGVLRGYATESPWERRGQILFVLMFVIGFPIMVGRAVKNGNTDFCGFYAAGQYVLQHGTRDPESVLSRYWPSSDVPWMVFIWLPLPLAAAIWYLVGCASWVALLRAIFHYTMTDMHPTTRRQATLAAGLLAMPLAIDGLCLGSFHILMVWLMLAGVHRAMRGQTLSGGVLLGVAAWLKLLPFLGVAMLLFHRRTKAAVTAVIVALSLDIVLSVGAFGLQGAWHEHVTWWTHGAAGTAQRQLTSIHWVDEDRLTNQSVAITLRRLLSSLGMADEGEGHVRVQLAELTPSQIEATFLVVMAISLIVVAAYCRPARNASPPEISAKIAMMLLATLWFSPVVWSYHFTAATPALAILVSRCRDDRLRRWSIVVVWLGALVMLASQNLRALGVLLWLGVAVGVALAWLWPAALPDDA